MIMFICLCQIFIAFSVSSPSISMICDSGISDTCFSSHEISQTWSKQSQRKVWPFRIQRKHQILRLSSNFPLTQMNRICEKEIFHVSVTSSLLNQELRWSDMSVTNSSLLLKSGGDFVSLWNSKHSGQSCLEIGMRDETII